jgi:hypothetical protein
VGEEQESGSVTDILQRLKNLAEVQRHFENTIYADAAAEVEKLRQDSEDAIRYRWLKSHIAPSIIARIDKYANGWPPEELDKLIDRRLKESAVTVGEKHV